MRVVESAPSSHSWQPAILFGVNVAEYGVAVNTAFDISGYYYLCGRFARPDFATRGSRGTPYLPKPNVAPPVPIYPVMYADPSVDRAAPAI